MARPLSQAEYFRAILLEDRLRLGADAGVTLTPVQVAFLKDALYQGHIVALGGAAKPMNPRQRNVKKTIVDGLRTSMAEVSFYSHVMGNLMQQSPVWLTPRDLRKVVSPRQIADLASDLCRLLGREYRDSVLASLRDAYAGAGERIQVVREPG